MKKALFILLLATGFAACDNESPQTEEPFQNPYAYVGEHHNLAVDQALETMIASKPASRADAQRQIEPLVESYMESNGFTKNLTDGQMQGFIRLGLYPASARSAVSAEQLLTAAQEGYIARIDGILSASTSASDVAAALDVLNQEVATALPEDDAATVLIVSAVASSSASYWYDHLDEWEARYGQTGTRSAARGTRVMLPPTWQQVAKVDAGGALGGALGSLFTGCAELTLGACAAGAAMGGSVAASVASFFQ